MNEFLLIVSLILTYVGVFLAYGIFGKGGLLVWSAFATVVANIEVSILIEAFGIVQTLGNVLFASTFLITDALSEIFGKSWAKRAVKLSIFFSLFFLGFSQLWLHYLPLEATMFEGLKSVFAQTPRVIAASLVVFAIASYLDVWLYHWWWNWSSKLLGSKRKWLWLRNNGSTLISQGINAILFSVCAFGGVYEWSVILEIICSSYLIFALLAILDTPALYAIVYLAKWKKDYNEPPKSL